MGTASTLMMSGELAVVPSFWNGEENLDVLGMRQKLLRNVYNVKRSV